VTVTFVPTKILCFPCYKWCSFSFRWYHRVLQIGHTQFWKDEWSRRPQTRAHKFWHTFLCCCITALLITAWWATTLLQVNKKPQKNLGSSQLSGLTMEVLLSSFNEGTLCYSQYAFCRHKPVFELNKYQHIWPFIVTMHFQLQFCSVTEYLQDRKMNCKFLESFLSDVTEGRRLPKHLCCSTFDM
jgi:hypothetical protein